MSGVSVRAYLRRELEDHLSRLGYSAQRTPRTGAPAAEVARVNPVRGRIAYGVTVVHADLRRRECHKQLLFFSQRRTRRRSSIPFFIAVAEADREELEALLEKLGVRDAVRGSHVQVVTVAAANAHQRKPAAQTPPG